MHLNLRCLCAPAIAALCLVSARISAADDETDKTALAVEALSRLQEVNLESNPKLKETVHKLLEKTRGTPSFVKLVRQFKLTNQSDGLLEVAIVQPAGESGIEAMRLLLANGDTSLIERTLETTNVIAAAKTAEALGNTGEKQVTKLLLPVLADSRRDHAAQAGCAPWPEPTRAPVSCWCWQARRSSDDLRFTASADLNGAVAGD
jgi:hypothetical protein